MDTLFDPDPECARDFDRERLRDRLLNLAGRGIYIGGSSWKYPGWLGQVYSRSRYQVRGRFSKKLFEDTCLSEYATLFPSVCGDFAFYQFPSEAMWAKLFRQTPEGFRFGFKVPEQITVARWPVNPRYGALAGLDNPTFLDSGLFEQNFLQVLEPWREKVGVLIFEFGTMRREMDFLADLDPFLSRLPAGWRWAVEVRNAEFLQPRYFDCLRAHNVAHVYSSWSRMPDLATQAAIPESDTADLIVARALLRPGRPYEQAVRMFAPYDRVQEINPGVRGALRELIHIALVEGRQAMIFVNNRLEGNSPGTIVALTD